MLIYYLLLSRQLDEMQNQLNGLSKIIHTRPRWFQRATVQQRIARNVPRSKLNSSTPKGKWPSGNEAVNHEVFATSALSIICGAV